MKNNHIILAFAILLCSAVAVVAQDAGPDSTKTVEVEKNDRSIIVGRIVSIDAKEVVIVTQSGRQYVPKHEIRRIGTPSPQQLRSQEMGQTPFGAYYGFTQGALPHEPDQGHLQITPFSADFELYLTDRLSVGLLSSVISAPIIGRASYTFSSRGDVHFSAGGFVGWGGSVARHNAIAMPTVSVTKGDSRNSFTLSAGYGVSTFVAQLFRFAGEYQRVDYRTGELVTDTILEAVDTRVNTPRAWLSIGLIAEVSSSISLVLDAFFISDAGLAKPSTNDAFYEHEYYLLNGEYFERLLPVPGVQTYSTIIISPSIRWKMSSRTSLQFGFTGYKGNFLNLEDNSSWSSLPIPMVQWFMKL
jgi:hypothetical protein